MPVKVSVPEPALARERMLEPLEMTPAKEPPPLLLPRLRVESRPAMMKTTAVELVLLSPSMR